MPKLAKVKNEYYERIQSRKRHAQSDQKRHHSAISPSNIKNQYPAIQYPATSFYTKTGRQAKKIAHLIDIRLQNDMFVMMSCEAICERYDSFGFSKALPLTR
jgi:hypothetical protein